MTPSDPQFSNGPFDARASFAARPASQAWEQVPIAEYPQHFVWAWFKPANLPQGLVVRVADETWPNFPQPDQLTMRRLLNSVGIPPETVASWQLYGSAFDGMNGTNPLLDNPIPAPVPDIDPNIVVNIQAAVAQPIPLAAQPMPQTAQPLPQAAQPMPRAVPQSSMNSEWMPEVFAGIEMEWNSILDIENDMEQLRKMLVEASGKLKGLNRDLTSEERLYASQSDERDWLEARRVLRDANLRLWACVKDYDSGDASTAGNRRWLEQMYEQFIVTRQPFDGIAQALGNYEFHRKIAATTQQKMNNALLHATNNAERNAQGVLNRIATKVREGQTRPGFLQALQD